MKGFHKIQDCLQNVRICTHSVENIQLGCQKATSISSTVHVCRRQHVSRGL